MVDIHTSSYQESTLVVPVPLLAVVQVIVTVWPVSSAEGAATFVTTRSASDWLTVTVTGDELSLA